MLDTNIYKNDYYNSWCPGCGNFGILEAMKDAFAKLELPPEKLLLISGIGQAAKTPHYLNCNMMHTLHGRALPIATGAKIANHELTVIVNSGDGDCYGEGGNHFLNAIRRNVDLTLLVHNNKVYGLTKGQASPTSDMGMVTKMQRHGVIAEPFAPLSVALALGAGFIARSFSGNKDHLSQMIREAVNYKGFSLVDIMQPCVSFNRVNTFKWYKDRAYDLAEEGYEPDDFMKAMEISRLWGDKIPIGILYKRQKDNFTDKLGPLDQGPLISQKYDGDKLRSFFASL